jgi:hypothetical protein
MTQLCDHPMEIALLRAVMAERLRVFKTSELLPALEWLGETKLANPKRLRLFLSRLREAGLVHCLADPDDPKGLMWAFNWNSSVQQRTGGIDPLTITPEELLEAFSWRGARRSAYSPDAWKSQENNKPGTDRALIQCSSPWQYAERMKAM